MIMIIPLMTMICIDLLNAEHTLMFVLAFMMSDQASWYKLYYILLPVSIRHGDYFHVVIIICKFR